MPYIGNLPVTQFASLDYQDLTGVTGVPAKRGYTLDNAVGSANDIEVFVNNVRQEPGVAYTVSGTTLTMTGDVETTDDFYVVFQGKAVGTVNVPENAVIPGTGSLTLPKGTDAQRPSTVVEGMVRYNTDDDKMELYANGGWEQVDSFKQYTVEYLVIAGGGSGGGGGGGGGAGGYRNSYASEASGRDSSTESVLTLNGGTQYTVTVGAGGSSVNYPNAGNSGNNSVFASITSIGGGEGNHGGNGGSGGSGGGGGYSGSGGSSTAGQGYDGGNGNNQSPGYPGGGGGGATDSGANASGSNGGNGGDGLSSSITASATTRAGGGGGGTRSGTAGTGGSGGGGNGGASSGNGVNGTNNTGSGGGGSGNTGTASGAGASGVVIIRVATANYSGTTTGSPTVSTDGTDTILTYTSSGTYTA